MNPLELKISINSLPDGKYKVMAVHNFQVEDCNPNIDECLAGIFLARYIDDEYEKPEDYPVECRTIKVLGYFDTHNKFFHA